MFEVFFTSKADDVQRSTIVSILRKKGLTVTTVGNNLRVDGTPSIFAVFDCLKGKPGFDGVRRNLEAEE